MTTTEKDIQIALGTYLPEVWKETCKLRAKSNKLWAEGNKLWAESGKLYAEGSKLWAEGHKLWAEGHKLRAESNKLWDEGHKLFTDAVIEVYGKNIIDWKGYGCIVDGREFRYDA